MSPLKKITKLNIWISFRRMLGLFLFFYATLHMLTYVVIDYRLNFESISKDILTKKFIFVGFAAWVLLTATCTHFFKKSFDLFKRQVEETPQTYLCNCDTGCNTFYLVS